MRAARTPARREFRVSLMVCLRGTFALKQRRPPNWEPSPSPSQTLEHTKKCAKCLFLLAEAVRFELTDGRPSPVFKTGAFNRSATLPNSSYNGFQDCWFKPLTQTSMSVTTEAHFNPKLMIPLPYSWYVFRHFILIFVSISRKNALRIARNINKSYP